MKVWVGDGCRRLVRRRFRQSLRVARTGRSSRRGEGTVKGVSHPFHSEFIALWPAYLQHGLWLALQGGARSSAAVGRNMTTFVSFLVTLLAFALLFVLFALLGPGEGARSCSGRGSGETRCSGCPAGKEGIPAGEACPGATTSGLEPGP